MSEIKVGDKVRVRSVSVGSISNFPFVEHCAEGMVSEISGGVLKVKFPHAEQWWHRWQCRKLVKVRKCDECGGEKTTFITGQSSNLNTGNIDYFPIKIACQKCHGTGKVKVKEPNA